MTTYTLAASFIEYSFTNGIIGSDNAASIDFVMPDGVDTFLTSTANITEGVAAMDVVFDYLNLRSDDALMDAPTTSQIYDVEWSGGRSSVLQLFFYDAALGWAVYFVHIGGDDLPAFDTLADATPFFQRASDPFSYADSPSVLPFTFFDDLTVTEDDLLDLDPSQTNDVIRTGAGADSVVGTFEADTILGGDGDDIILGGEGKDRLGGGHGDDSLIGELDNDKLWGSFGNDTALGGDGDDTIVGGAGDDVLDGGIGSDTIDGSEGDDRIYGQKGNDTLHGDEGFDSIYGGLGQDSINAGQADDQVWGGEGDDRIDGGFGADTLYGGTGNDTLTGADGRDQLLGRAGDDVLSGGDGNDSLDAGSGHDTIYASTGNDTVFADYGNDQIYLGQGQDVFIWSAGQNDIFDFNPSEGDSIEIDVATGITDFDDLIENHLTSTSQAALITDDAGHTLWLHGIDPTALTVSNFLFIN